MLRKKQAHNESEDTLKGCKNLFAYMIEPVMIFVFVISQPKKTLNIEH